jgi:Tfp pilus assembly protein PilF
VTRYNITISTMLLLSVSACSPNHRVKKGDAHLEAQRPDAAAAEYQRALDKDPSHVAALRGMAASHLSKMQPVRAILPAQRAAKSGDVQASRLLVRALLTTGRSEDAHRTVEKSVEAHPADVAM